VRAMQRRRRHSAEVRRRIEGLVRGYAVRQTVQVQISAEVHSSTKGVSAEVRRAAEGLGADLRSSGTAKLRIFTGLYW